MRFSIEAHTVETKTNILGSKIAKAKTATPARGAPLQARALLAHRGKIPRRAGDASPPRRPAGTTGDAAAHSSARRPTI
ncbi:MAG TPA: hypothetical protein VHK47_17720 [Polyangia bacterium]|nr:hypothetical protein [Polyangia bacterium]